MKNKSSFKGTVLTIGNFDGVHLGHQKLIKTVLRYSQKEKKPAVLYTFSPHPAQFLHPQKKHLRLCPLSQSEQILRKMGLKHFIVQKFNKSFSQTSPEDFLEYIVRRFQPLCIVVGSNFRFGAGGKGSCELLKKSAKKFGFRLKIVPPVKKNNQIVSTSLIKKQILAGQWEEVSSLLGRPFSLTGKVIKGEGRGKTLGFPTLNLKTEKDILLPKAGVYTVQLRKKNQSFRAVMNIGTNPTFSNKCLKKIEVHVIGKNLLRPALNYEVDILGYLRPEKKFSHSHQLMAQIQKDIQQAKEKKFNIL